MVQRNGSAGLTKVSKSSDNGIVCVMWPGIENFNNQDIEVNYSEKVGFYKFLLVNSFIYDKIKRYYLT